MCKQFTITKKSILDNDNVILRYVILINAFLNLSFNEIIYYGKLFSFSIFLFRLVVHCRWFWFPSCRPSCHLSGRVFLVSVLRAGPVGSCVRARREERKKRGCVRDWITWFLWFCNLFSLYRCLSPFPVRAFFMCFVT